jgi:hypothetical protein
MQLVLHRVHASTAVADLAGKSIGPADREANCAKSFVTREGV